LVEQVLHEADIEAKDVSHILLVGGSTRIPAFSKSIKSIMGKEPISKVNVDEAVALGAAIKAGLITVANEPHKVSANIAREINSVKLTDVANHSYGTIISTYDRVLDKHILANSIIIGKNTQLPCSFTKTFYTVSDGQEAVDISITQGEDADPDFVDKIHEENMDLPPNRPSGQPIEVTYQYDENQIMHCIFKDVNSGRSKPIQLNMQNSKKKSLDLNSFLVE
jgi:molecular chaperone DnaK